MKKSLKCGKFRNLFILILTLNYKEYKKIQKL